VEPAEELDQLARSVLDAAMDVHRHLGPGFLEKVYEEALCAELSLRGIPFKRQQSFSVVYKGRPVDEARLDLLVAGALFVDVESVSDLAPIHTAQVLSYLKTTQQHLGLLINFNVPLLREGIKRVILTPGQECG